MEQHSQEMHLKKCSMPERVRGTLDIVACSWKLVAHMSIQYVIPRAGGTTENMICKVLLFMELTLWGGSRHTIKTNRINI